MMDISRVKEEGAKLSRKSSLQSPSEVSSRPDGCWAPPVLQHCPLPSGGAAAAAAAAADVVHPHMQPCSPSKQRLQRPSGAGLRAPPPKSDAR